MHPALSATHYFVGTEFCIANFSLFASTQGTSRVFKVSADSHSEDGLIAAAGASTE